MCGGTSRVLAAVLVAFATPARETTTDLCLRWALATMDVTVPNDVRVLQLRLIEHRVVFQVWAGARPPPLSAAVRLALYGR